MSENEILENKKVVEPDLRCSDGRGAMNEADDDIASKFWSVVWLISNHYALPPFVITDAWQHWSQIEPHDLVSFKIKNHYKNSK